ncbi:MAG: ATPase [Prevotella sp.]
MILIADSGSTKTDWCAVEGKDVVKRVSTSGINPYHQDTTTIRRIVCGELLTQLDGAEPTEVVFYGSGCREEKIPMVREILSKAFEKASGIEVNGDLLGAARAVCGFKEGIACILGTGSNSCLYDGERIVENISPLGYILGDEGSGAVLGKMFVNEILKNKALADVRDDFFQLSRMDVGDIIERVYRQPQANKFLASIAPFVGKHIGNPLVRTVVVENFRQFFQKNVMRYGKVHLPVGFVGSIAWHFQAELAVAADLEGLTLGTVVKSPMDGLLDYHCR